MATRDTVLTARGCALLTAFLLALGGCGGDGERTATIISSGGSASSGGSGGSGGEAEVGNTVSGSIGDGPIVNARVRVFSRNGTLIQESSSGATADYEIVVRTKIRNYPLTVMADQGTDLVTGTPPDFKLFSTVLSPASRTTSNVNPFSTLILESARLGGGVTEASLETARRAVTERYGFGLDTALLPDPTTSRITNANIHAIVKTSETLGEMVRRTRDALYVSGANLDGDGVVRALSADLSDGWIDGNGAHSADARVAAVANVASAAVLVQAMANRLHVNGANATQMMDNAIRQVRPNAPASATTANVPIPATALDQAVRALSAALAVSGDPRILDAIEVMESAVPGILPGAIAAKLPASLDTVLDQAVLLAATASDDTLQSINTVARTSLPPGGSSSTPPPSGGGGSGGGTQAPGTGNQAPVISGTPGTALVAGDPWSFQPKASDPEGDALTYSIQGMPSWASFSTSTGRLSGTPTEAGTHESIVITVSDGKSYASLPAFTLHVAAPATGTAMVSWTPPTERTDGSVADLGGYRIYYGTSTGSMTRVINITNPGQVSHVVENLAAGTWYFSVTAICSRGLESAKSVIGRKTIT
jgi:hypothetical protein